LAEFSVRDLLSGVDLRAVCDSGAAVTCISHAYATQCGLVVQPLADHPSLPTCLGLAQDGQTMPVLGGVVVELLLANSGVSFTTTVAVVADLFRPLVLGRNVLEAARGVYGGPVLLDAAGLCVRPAAAAVASLEADTPARATRDVWVHGSEGTASVEQLIDVSVWVPDSSLRGAHGERVVSVDGVFTPHERSADYKTSAAVVRAAVDYSAAVEKGLRRVRFLVSMLTATTQRGRSRVIRERATLGTFTASMPHVAAVPADATSPASPPVDHLAGVIAATMESPLLQTEADRRRAREVLSGFTFTEDLEEAARATAPPFEIHLMPGARVVTRRNYGRSPVDDEFAEEQIRKWRLSGTIQPSTSPWASPLVVAHHPRTGKSRLCVDYRGLNAFTVPDSYLMPRIEDIQRALKGKKVFSKVDLSQGFNQYALSEKARPLTAFNGPRSGHFEFVGSPFGLRNLPSAFQRLMDTVLGTMGWARACVYVDDVIVFSDSVADHHEHLRELADRFAAFNIQARASKCCFYMAEVEFVGFVFSGDSMSATPSKVEAVLKVQPPKSREEIRRFLGLLGQFRQHIRDFATIAGPLERMKHKLSKVPFDMSPSSPALASFGRLREELVRMPKLAIPDMNAPFRAYQDSSDHATGLVLTQVQDGVEVPIGFYSKSFSGSQLNWTPPKKEAWGLRHWLVDKLSFYFVAGGPHEIFVDAKGSAALGQPTLKEPMLKRIAIALQPLNLVIKLIPGNVNPADALTRPPFVAQPDPSLESLQGMLNPLLQHTGWREVAQEHAVRGSPVIGAADAPFALPTTPFSLADLRQHQQEDEWLQANVSYIAAGRPRTPKPDLDALPVAQRAGALAAWKLGRADERRQQRETSGWVQQDGIWWKARSHRGKVRARAVIPVALRDQALAWAHNGNDAAVHLGNHGEALRTALARDVWWPRLDLDVRAFMCPTCARQRADRHAPVGRLHTSGASVPGELLSADNVPMPACNGNVGFIVLQDRFSGFVVAEPYSKKDSVSMANGVLRALRNTILLPRTLLVDRGSELNSQQFFDALSARGIDAAPVFPEHQQANFVERSIGFVKSVLRTTLEGLPRTAWCKALPDVVRAVNCHRHESKGASPFEILTGVAPPSGFPVAWTSDPVWLEKIFKEREGLWSLVRKNMDKAALRQEQQFDKRLGPRRAFQVGDAVLLRTRGDSEFNLQPAFERNPWVVTDVLSDVSLRVRSWEKASDVQEVHVDQVRPAVLEELDPRESSDGSDAGFVVESILDHKGEGPARMFKVRWGGFKNAKQDTWEPRESLAENAGELVARYERMCTVAS